MEGFKAVRVVQSFTFPVHGSADQIFPLLCPVRELEWLHGWACAVIYTRSGVNEKGCIFRTAGLNGAETIWVTTRHDKEAGRVEFVQDVRDLMVVNLNISLGATEGGVTPVTFGYIFTSLSEKGNAYLTSGFEKPFSVRVAWLDRSLNHFLKTGAMLKP